MKSAVLLISSHFKHYGSMSVACTQYICIGHGPHSRFCSVQSEMKSTVQQVLTALEYSIDIRCMNTVDFTCVEQLVYSVAWPYTFNSITESRHGINQLFNASEIRCIPYYVFRVSMEYGITALSMSSQQVTEYINSQYFCQNTATCSLLCPHAWAIE